MQIGIQLYGTQLPPAASATAVAPERSSDDAYRLISQGMDADFLLIGGAPPGEVADLGRAAELIVPLAASALAMLAPGVDMVAKLSTWAFDPAHIARIGANLAQFTGDRCALYLAADPGSWPCDDKDRDAATQVERMQDYLAIVFQHWAGRADFSGPRLRSVGRMVGPRPERDKPRIMLDAALGAATSASMAPDCLVMAYGDDAGGSSARDVMVTCPVILARSSAEAKQTSRQIRSLSADRCIVGDADHVIGAIAALARQPVQRIAVGFPAMRGVEYDLFRNSVLPKLRALTGAGGGPR